jgi:L-lysine 2,3-aminomutase
MAKNNKQEPLKNEIIETFPTQEKAIEKLRFLTHNHEEVEGLRKKYPNKEIMLIPNRIGFSLIAKAKE